MSVDPESLAPFGCYTIEAAKAIAAALGEAGAPPGGSVGDVQFNKGDGTFANADGVSSGYTVNLNPSTGQLQVLDADQADGIVLDASVGVVIKCSATNIVSIQDFGGNLLNIGGPNSTLDGILIQATATATSSITINGHKIGFFGASSIVKPTVTGAKAGNTALASLITQLAALGLVTDSTT